MSATLRWYLAECAVEWLNAAKFNLDKFDISAVNYWAGHRDGNVSRWQITMNLPLQVLEVYDFYKFTAWQLSDREVQGRLWNALDVLRKKLCDSLGLPYTATVLKDEAGFLDAITREPYSLANWGIYADWLQ